ncbi:hypothetical protein CDL15_Pgr008609 [Punica granatum]|uniref:Protein CDC73 homolog n=1 Tax=Punica granatum TaxID=22663 RepID=A0A218WND2_PUNGR|nr:hypothetical protein CDL15_Pgr008609 [Punica granatum]
MDPLSALRDFTIRGELDKIVRFGDEFRFGSDYAFPCTAETAYRSKQGNLYTLETLVFYVKNHQLKHTEYIQSARTQQIPSVTFIDRKPLLEYLQGKVDTTDAIELFPSAPTPAPAPAAADDVSMPEAAPTDSRVVDEPPVVDFMSMIRAVERPLKDREALLECRNRDFYSVLINSTKHEEERQRLESQQRKDGLVAKSRLMGAEERGVINSTKREEERQRLESQQRKDGLVAKSRLMGAEERGVGFGDELGYNDSGLKPKLNLKGGNIGEGVPIILVPSAFHTLITIYNVKEFLEDGVFIPTDVKAKQMNGTKPDCITVQKKFGRHPVLPAYEVRDKPSSLKREDWDRVVAVFVLGKEWQFKDWPFKDHVEIFNKIIGFFMRFEDDSVESAKTVKQWNVKIISVESAKTVKQWNVKIVSSSDRNIEWDVQISKNKRHQDRAAALEEKAPLYFGRSSMDT